MFESAIQAATSAARAWTPDLPDPSGDSRCCLLCLHRYRVLVLNGPLLDLPHGVAHAAVVAIDEVITTRMAALEEQFSWDAWTVLLSEQDRERELMKRSSAAIGGLIVAARDELSAARGRLSELRRAYTEPAMAGFLAHHRVPEVPPAWL